MKRISFNLHKLIYNKRFAVAISIILSFSMWLIIMINQNPVRDQTFNDITASIAIDNTAASEMGLGIVSDVSSQKFSVTVSGPNYIVSSLKPDDFLLSASVVDVNAAGKYKLKVNGVRNSSKSGYTFVGISPSYIEVTFDYIDAKEFTVTPKLIGVGATEGLIAETPTISNTEQSTITIKGPRSIMQKIESVTAYAEVNKTLGTAQSFDADIILYDSQGGIVYRYASDGKIYDADGKTIDNTLLTLSYTSVKVTQPISKKATFPVKVTFSNLPNSGMTVKYTVEHETVSVIGTPDIVNNLSSVTLSPIDFRNVSSTSNSFEVSASLPDGVKLLDNIEYFTVKIDTSGYMEKTIMVSEMKYSGLKSGLKVTYANKIRNVKICGPKEVIEKATPADFFALIDLSDKSAGEYTVDVVIKSSKYTDIWQVGNYNTAITVK